MSKATDFLNSHQSAVPSRWRENAQWRRDNERWLGCSQQYVSNLLKGNSNMTLETIAKLESALQISLWGSTSIVDGYQPAQPSRQYLNDINPSEYGSGEK